MSFKQDRPGLSGNAASGVQYAVNVQFEPGCYCPNRESQSFPSSQKLRTSALDQPYFIVVLAHSLHGRLRRIHVPYAFLYVVLALAGFGALSLVGLVSSYVRMSWKVANYNTL